MKVLFGIGFLLESLGLDIGVTRLALTFMLQCAAISLLDVPLTQAPEFAEI